MLQFVKSLFKIIKHFGNSKDVTEICGKRAKAWNGHGASLSRASRPSDLVVRCRHAAGRARPGRLRQSAPPRFRRRRRWRPVAAASLTTRCPPRWRSTGAAPRPSRPATSDLVVGTPAATPATRRWADNSIRTKRAGGRGEGEERQRRAARPN